ncbi:MAG: hypothetical protein M0R06_02490 [Sphaerochaeta sp.]|jgi:hypothetical protein|nr:hypothetical protein [Sphaerochaeta sp.]
METNRETRNDQSHPIFQRMLNALFPLPPIFPPVPDGFTKEKEIVQDADGFPDVNLGDSDDWADEMTRQETEQAAKEERERNGRID